MSADEIPQPPREEYAIDFFGSESSGSGLPVVRSSRNNCVRSLSSSSISASRPVFTSSLPRRARAVVALSMMFNSGGLV